MVGNKPFIAFSLSSSDILLKNAYEISIAPKHYNMVKHCQFLADTKGSHIKGLVVRLSVSLKTCLFSLLEAYGHPRAKKKKNLSALQSNQMLACK